MFECLHTFTAFPFDCSSCSFFANVQTGVTRRETWLKVSRSSNRKKGNPLGRGQSRLENVMVLKMLEGRIM